MYKLKLVYNDGRDKLIMKCTEEGMLYKLLFLARDDFDAVDMYYRVYIRKFLFFYKRLYTILDLEKGNVYGKKKK